MGSGSSTGCTSGVGISRFFGHGCSTPISETTPLSVRGFPGPRGENISSSIGSQNPGSTTTYQRRPGGFRPTDAQALIPISERVNPTAPLATFGGGGNPHSGCSDLSAPCGFSRVPTSKNAIHLLRSLSCNPPSRSGGLDLHGSYRPDWSREDPATTVPQRRGAFVGLAATPAKVPTPECRVSLPFGKANESDSGTACCSASQLGEGCRARAVLCRQALPCPHRITRSRIQ